MDSPCSPIRPLSHVPLGCSILNLRSKGTPSSSGGVKQFSPSRGRWVTEVAIQESHNIHTDASPSDSIALSHIQNGGSPNHTMFGEDPKRTNMPLAFASMGPPPGGDLEVGGGVGGASLITVYLFGMHWLTLLVPGGVTSIVRWDTEHESWDHKGDELADDHEPQNHYPPSR